jgi:preprotein translocase subunit SecA
MIDEVVTDLVEEFVPEKANEIDMTPVEEKVLNIFDLRLDWKKMGIQETTQQTVGQALYESLQKSYEEKETRFTTEAIRQAERVVLLSTLDALWKDHLLSMDHLREGIGLRGYGQKDPLLEYKREGFQLFQNMIRQFREDVLEKIFHIQIAEERQVAQMRMPRTPLRPASAVSMGRGVAPTAANIPASGPGLAVGRTTPSSTPAQQPVHLPKVGRNDPCPCGSGKKYKKCCGA